MTSQRHPEQRHPEQRHPEQVERGVKNPKVVDLISHDPGTDQVIFLFIEDRPWGSDPLQFEQLGDKFNNYLDYVLDGWFLKQYPHYAGKKLSFVLEYAQEPDNAARTKLRQLEAFAASTGISFISRPACAA